MRIVTLNTWKNEGDYPRRLRLMADGLAALTPDVVCLQECFIGAGLDTAAHLSRALGLENHPRPSRAKPRAHEGRETPSTSGLAILCRTAVLAEAALALPRDDADGERLAQRLDLVGAGGRLRILNLHLTHLRGPRSAALRARQLVAALEWAASDPAVGLVVAGDLNASAGDVELAALEPSVGFEAATLLGGRADAPAARGRAIDHLVLQAPGGWRAAARFRGLDQADPDGFRPSDHAAVVLDLVPQA